MATVHSGTSDGVGSWVPVNEEGWQFIDSNIPAANAATFTYEQRINGGEPSAIAKNGTPISHSAGASIDEFFANPGCEIRATRAGSSGTSITAVMGPAGIRSHSF